MTLLLKLLMRHLRRRPGRTTFTILGVASAMLLYVSVESLSEGFEQAMSSGDRARTLIVYRMNRYCPMTSHLPERYGDRIAEIDAAFPSAYYLRGKIHSDAGRLDVAAREMEAYLDLWGIEDRTADRARAVIARASAS